MAEQRLVAVSYPVNEEYEAINSAVLGTDAELDFLQRLPEADRPSALARADALIGWNLGRELPLDALRHSPRLRFVQLLSAGADAVDFTTVPPGLVLASNVGAYAEPIAEHVLAMTLALARRLPQRHAALAAGDFDQREPLLTLDGATCLILGFGGIGRATARLMRALGARIHAVTRSGQMVDGADEAGTLADLDGLLPAADVVVVALPLTSLTRGLLGAAQFARMKPTAIVVNVARGDLIDEGALYAQLREHPEFGAGLDVWWDEPAAGSPFRTRYPFFDLPNVLGSPHNSGIVSGVLPAAARQAAQNVRRHLRGEPVTGVVRREEYL